MKKLIWIGTICAIWSESCACLSSFRSSPSDRSTNGGNIRSNRIVSNFVPIGQDNLHNSYQNGQLPVISKNAPSDFQPIESPNSRLLIHMGRNKSSRYVTVRNQGEEDEFIQMNVFDSNGETVPIFPSQFNLARGSVTEIPLSVSSHQKPKPNQKQIQTTTKYVEASSNNNEQFITVQARGKRDSVERSFLVGDPYEGGNYSPLEPFCFDKDVTGTCRYRSDPDECFRWHWTAYATILNQGGGQKISSIPEGLFLTPGEHGRVRVYLKISCCTPIVQFISTDPYYHTGVNSCVIDVRELQVLHPGEIAGIAVAAVVLILIIIVVIFVCVRKRRKETISVGMLPRARSREVISRQQI